MGVTTEAAASNAPPWWESMRYGNPLRVGVKIRRTTVYSTATMVGVKRRFWSNVGFICGNRWNASIEEMLHYKRSTAFWFLLACHTASYASSEARPALRRRRSGMITVMEETAKESWNHHCPSNYDDEAMLGTKRDLQQCTTLTAFPVGREKEEHGLTREDQNTTPVLEMESHEEEETRDVVLYPAGGAFNKLRKKQVFLEQLLSQHWAEYSAAPSHLKKDYVQEHILQRIYDTGRTLKIFQGTSPVNGSYFIPEADVAFERLAQKLRDTKKMSLPLIRDNAAATIAPSRKRSQRRKSKSGNDTAPPTRKPRKVSKKRRVEDVPLTTLASSSSSLISYASHEDVPAPTKLLVPLPRKSPERRASRKSMATTTTNASSSLQELQEIVWSQWEQIDCWRRLCARYKETNEVQRQVIRQQDAMLTNGKTDTPPYKR